jgi:hypothetical protein
MNMLETDIGVLLRKEKGMTRNGMLMAVVTCGLSPRHWKRPEKQFGFLTVSLGQARIGTYNDFLGWLSPELYLRRPPAKNEKYRIDNMLKAAAERGVKVNIIVYKEVCSMFCPLKVLNLTQQSGHSSINS